MEPIGRLRTCCVRFVYFTVKRWTAGGVRVRIIGMLGMGEVGRRVHLMNLLREGG